MPDRILFHSMFRLHHSSEISCLDDHGDMPGNFLHTAWHIFDCTPVWAWNSRLHK